MRPHFRLLEDTLIGRILDEARDILQHMGVKVQNPTALALLAEVGAEVDTASQQVRMGAAVIDRALASTPRGFSLHDQAGQAVCDFSGHKVHFTPGSAAINLLDEPSGELRRPSCRDYVRYAKVVDGLPHLASQSTCMVPSDVPERAGDSIRLFLSLLHGRKPVVTGCFTAEAFEVMRDLQVIVRGSAQALADKPLCVFSCCPTSPLKWSDVTSQNVIDCARAGIPVEFIAMPLTGFMAPVTLVGTLVAHTAETLSGVVLAQAARAGTPILYGGSPAAFDIRYETTPMGAVETQMIDCATSEIGKFLGLPTQAYIGLSDAKALDAQAGLESSMGMTLAALSGINSVSGPGMLDFESCQSLEKLVVDDEI
ncbi:MAG: trimethylamine methyltransferase family protein, partial [Pseudomonadota bacterium]